MSFNFSITYNSDYGISPSAKIVTGVVEYRSRLPKYIGVDGEYDFENMILYTDQQGLFCNDNNVYGFILPTNISSIVTNAAVNKYCSLTLSLKPSFEANDNGYDIHNIPMYAIDNNLQILEEYPTNIYDWIEDDIPGITGDLPLDNYDNTILTITSSSFLTQIQNIYIKEVTGETAIGFADSFHDAINSNICYEVGNPWATSNPIYTLQKEDLPTIVAPGYVFKGWFFNNDTLAESGMTIENDIVLTAKWNIGEIVGVSGGMTGQLLQFLFGNNFTNKDIPFNPGSFYLDVNTGELWIDDPSNINLEHNKIIDTETLIYSIEDSTMFPATNEKASSKLGISVLGIMKLGSNT